MNKEMLSPLSGFRDRVGNEKYQLISALRSLFVSYGYIGLETPVIEKQEVLLNKYGEDAQKLLYLFEDNGQRKVGLRYDLTLPLARFVAGNYNELALPFKRYEIGTVFRAEKPQKGRYRQITQADVDVVGSSSVEIKKELLAIIADFNELYNLDLICAINDRRILNEIFDALKIEPSQRSQLMILLDKKEKISPDQFAQELNAVGLSATQKNSFQSIFIDDDSQSALKKLVNPQLLAQVDELIASEQGRLKIVFRSSMVRGLDYYTGFIVECGSEQNKDIGSVIAGGEYNDLIKSLGGEDLPAVGISFGVDRLIELINLDNQPVLFITNTTSLSNEIYQWAKTLRQRGRAVEVYPDKNADLAKQLKYVNKRGLQSVLLALEDEWKEGKIIEKNLVTGEQKVKDRKGYEN